MSRLLPLLGLLLPGFALAGTPVELPPGEDTAAWKEALALGRQLVPGLELGLAVGPGPSVRILPQDDGWALHIRGAEGHVEPVMLPVPDTAAARLELLLVCADALAGSPPTTATPTDQEAPAATSWHLGSTLLAAGYDPLPGEGRPVTLLLEPSSLRWRQLSLSPLLSVGLPTAIEPDLRLMESQLSLHAWWSTAGRLRWRMGAGAGVELRDIATQDQPLMRDWSTIASLDTDLSLAVAGGWRPQLGLSLVSALPPTVLLWQGEELALPTWSLVLVAGVRLPWPIREL